MAALFVNLRSEAAMPDEERDMLDDLLNDIEAVVEDLVDHRKVELFRPV